MRKNRVPELPYGGISVDSAAKTQPAAASAIAGGGEAALVSSEKIEGSCDRLKTIVVDRCDVGSTDRL